MMVCKLQKDFVQSMRMQQKSVVQDIKSHQEILSSMSLVKWALFQKKFSGLNERLELLSKAYGIYEGLFLYFSFHISPELR